MPETILPDSDWSTHPVQLCCVTVAKSMKPDAPGLGDPDALKQQDEFGRGSEFRGVAARESGTSRDDTSPTSDELDEDDLGD